MAKRRNEQNVEKFLNFAEERLLFKTFKERLFNGVIFFPVIQSPFFSKYKIFCYIISIT